MTTSLQQERIIENTEAKTANFNQESVFKIDELFFSRTDTRGVLEAFNTVFSRISEHSDDALRGAPHKIIRHGDMPKAVFWLIWDTLKAGKPITGYVKNRSKSGRHYWVYAVISPVDGGYLSVRMKPTSPMLATVSDLYKRILRLEREDGLSPEKSASALLQEIQAMGFDDYADFEAHALVTEFQAREKALGRAPFDALVNAIRVAEAERTICDKLSSITDELAQGAIYILNMKLQAAKLGRDRAAIDAISNNYDLILGDIKSGITRIKSIMSGASTSNVGARKESQILLCASGIMAEVVQSFDQGDDPMTTAERDRESAYLRNLHAAFSDKSNASVSAMMDECRQMLGRMDSLRQTLLGLSAVRVSLRVETNRLGERARGLDSLISDIDRSHQRVHKDLEQVFETASHFSTAITAS